MVLELFPLPLPFSTQPARNHNNHGVSATTRRRNNRGGNGQGHIRLPHPDLVRQDHPWPIMQIFQNGFSGNPLSVTIGLLNPATVAVPGRTPLV